MRNIKGRFTKKTPLIILIGLIAIIFFLVWFIPVQRKYNDIVHADTVSVATTTEYVDMTPAKIAKAQDKLLDRLSLGCEVNGVTEPDSVILLDTNKQMSLGRFQFQIKTVQFYAKKLDGKTLNKHDAIILALDESQSRELARKIIFIEKGGVENNWTNCAVAHQLIKEVEVIKEFMAL